MEYNFILCGITKNGFLPTKCLNKLPEGVSFLNTILDNLDISDGKAFKAIVNTNNLNNSITCDKNNLDFFKNEFTYEEIKYIYSMVSLMSHKYLTCNGRCDKLPEILAIPFYYSSTILGLPIISTLTTLVHNWSLIDESKPFSLYNLKINNTIYNDPSEKWFYIVTIAIEYNSSKLLKILPTLYDCIKENNTIEVKNCIKLINNLIYDNKKILLTLNKETCNPRFFYDKLRPTLEGYDNEEIYPQGLLLEGITHPKISIKGGSAGQSTYIQILDILYGIQYTGEKKKFILNVRNFMTQKQRNLIKYIEELPSIKNFVSESDDELIRLYEEGINLISEFRKEHYRIIYQYIYEINKDSLGTGGTQPLKFSKSMISNTNNSLIKSSFQNSLIKKEFLLYFFTFIFIYTFFQYLYKFFYFNKCII